MSSQISSAKHFNSVERKLKYLFCFDSNFSKPYPFKKLFPKLYFTRDFKIDTIEDQLSEIFDTIRKIQVLTVALQYKSHYEGELNKNIESWTTSLLKDKKEFKNLTSIELLKALESIFYQIEIEHLTELRPLTTDETNALEFFKIIIPSIANLVISELPQYESAEWSI